MEPCHGCIQGTIHEGQPQGTEELVHGLNTYVVGNRTNPRAIVVMYSDIFGLLLPNNKLIADAYAKSGEYLVYLPDFFKGDPVPLKVADVMIPVDATRQSTFAKYTGLLASMPTFLMWRGRHKHMSTERICVEFLQKLRRNTRRGQKIGMVGFCWGGRYAVRAGLASNAVEIDGEKVPLVDAVVALHPSNMVVPVDVEALAVPTSFGWGVEDSVVSFDQKAMVEETHAKVAAAGGKVPITEHKTYNPGRHGFGVRGNPDNPAERACLEGTEKQVLDWFQRWL
ncbi:alpha/beta-hydrolase [Mytilinidion resinicola]|uniref:Alpha/beta-hydrolase n=1 Tax=Mytilinidion resinicola TaxID=574789 RepID=A0A6A6YT85_9PEZI|nr:alpha/beta-hydrolase [Mytilinidion resinicola]KAF2811778.1 alpha/beta-hydrolase [Mytilinidion resinicola]